MEAYFEMYPEEKLFFVFEDGNVFFAKDKNLAEKHKRDTNKDYQLIHKSLVDTDGEAISEAIEKLQDSDEQSDLEEQEEKEQSIKPTRKTK